MKKIIVHAGTVKTGSTYVQRILYESKKSIESFGFHYCGLSKPELELPRWANARFLFDNSYSDNAIEQYFDQCGFENIIISEEGLWPNLDKLNRQPFLKNKSIVTLCARDPVETVVSWAGEYCMAYNALPEEAPVGYPITSFVNSIELALNDYISCYEKFFRGHDLLRNNIEFKIFPYSKNQVQRNFAECLDLPYEALSSIVSKENVTRGRKYCDVSCLAYMFLEILEKKYLYTTEFVDNLYRICTSGTESELMATVPIHLLDKIFSKTEHVCDEIYSRFHFEFPEKPQPTNEITLFEPADPFDVFNNIKALLKEMNEKY